MSEARFIASRTLLEWFPTTNSYILENFLNTLNAKRAFNVDLECHFFTNFSTVYLNNGTLKRQTHNHVNL